jgi:superfamily I DNA/RNA helicase
MEGAIEQVDPSVAPSREKRLPAAGRAVTSLPLTRATTGSHVASPSQRVAIEAGAASLLVLAGPGAGKTYCLTERVGFLIERLGVDPTRICAFTFTNKAAGEITHRLEGRLGDAAARIQGGTIHAFCAGLLRELGAHVAIDPGFGIADEEYQLGVLRRLEGPRRWHRRMLTQFSTHRLRGDALHQDDAELFAKYENYLASRHVLDFDSLVIKALALLEHSDAGRAVRARWDVVLVDEFQDLNPVQYRVIRALARDHKHVFAVGDDEQSIYSWAGADPVVFREFIDDFAPARTQLDENRRCPHQVFALARKLVTANTPLFPDRLPPIADRESVFPVAAIGFDTDDGEAAWIIEDMRRDREQHGHDWGEVALLYRKHEIGERIEAACISAGIPARLAEGRALADDPVVAYVIAALRVIDKPHDEQFRDALFAATLPSALFDDARAQAEAGRRDLRHQLNRMVGRLPRGDETGRQVRRALADWRNLPALGRRHATLGSLVQELLSRRVGKIRSVLDDRSDEITDPGSLRDVIALAGRLTLARDRRTQIWIPRMGGVEIGLKGILGAIGLANVCLGGAAAAGAERLTSGDVPSVGLALGLFKAAQLIEIGDYANPFANFTAIDLETTGRDPKTAEIVDIAAVRVRDGKVTETFGTLVRPRIRIEPGAAETHGITEVDVAAAPHFEEIWPQMRAFCGDDVVVAHNGYLFDFRILKRLAESSGPPFDLCTYDSLPLARDLLPTSRKLENIAQLFGIPTGRSHRALDDTVVLAQVVLRLDELRAARARKTALVSVLDQLGIALALSGEDTLCPEARQFRGFTRVFALSRYSTCLETYEREQGDDITIPTVDDVIERLGGADLMVKVRSEKDADERYPRAMLRLRRLIGDLPDVPLGDQLALFLERVALSTLEGEEVDRRRANLLTLHSTKGLEFSRVYIVGAEDSQLPGGSPRTGPTIADVEEARRLLYVGMTRAKDRLVLTHAATRGGKPTGGHQFLDEMGLTPERH